MSMEFGGQAQFDLVAVAQSSSDQYAFGEKPGRAVEHRPGTMRACIQLRRVDHQHRRTVAAQELTPGEMDRLAAGPAFGKTRLLQHLESFEGRK